MRPERRRAAKRRRPAMSERRRPAMCEGVHATALPARLTVPRRIVGGIAAVLVAASAGCVPWRETSPAPPPLVVPEHDGTAAAAAAAPGAAATAAEPRAATSVSDGRSAVERSFSLRCAAPAVVRCVSFDTPEQVADLSWWAVGEQTGRGPMGALRNDAAALIPERDCTVAVAGCSLRFTIRSRSGAGDSGSWFVNFSDDLSVRFGEGQEFYVQWRQRFSKTFLDTRFRGNGWKQAIIGQGDRPGYLPDGKVIWSCTEMELVVENTLMRGYPQMYHSCGGKDGQYEPLWNDRAPPYRADEWMTFQVKVKIGTWYHNDRKYHRDSTVELWVAREGGRSQRVVVADGYDLANADPGASYGKL